jgi:hypothetical protein
MGRPKEAHLAPQLESQLEWLRASQMEPHLAAWWHQRQERRMEQQKQQLKELHLEKKMESHLEQQKVQQMEQRMG